MVEETPGPSGGEGRAEERTVDLAELSNWLVAGLVVAIVGAYLYRYAEPGGPEGLVERPAPSFRLEQVGSEGRLGPDDFRGDVVLLDFWATWCPPCHEQARYLKEFAEKSSVGDDVKILLVNTDKSGPKRTAKVRSYLARRGLEFPTVLDDGTAQQAYGVRSFPTLVVIGPTGSVRFAESGVHGTEELVEIVETIRGGAGG